MKIRDCQVQICERPEIKSFVETWHYSKSINGIMSDYCFKMMHAGEIVGAAIYGKMAMAGAYKKYGESASDVIELRRLCCIDETPKNAESRLIGRSLRWLKQNTDIKKIISYADANYGHSGVIYQASNFEKLGMTSRGKMIKYNNKLYHDKCIRTKYKGALKPFAKRIKDALESGEAICIKTLPKNIYLYKLRD